MQRPLTYWLFVAGVAAVIGALPFIHVDVSVGARGVTRAAAERVIVRAPVGGEIKSVGIRNDAAVRRGDTIVVIESRVLSGRITLNRQQQFETNRQLSDLGLQIDTFAGLSSMENNSTGSAIEAEVEIAPSAFQTATYLRQWEYFISQLETKRLQEARTRQERERLSPLHKQGLVTEHDFELLGYAADGARLDRQQFVRQNLSRWQAERLERQSRLQELSAEAIQLARQEELYTVRAPTDGTVLDFNGVDVGIFVADGAKLADITPGGKLVVDAYVSPKDLGFIRVGQQARLLVDAFPHTQRGPVSGTVRTLSDDLVQVGGQAVFKAVVELDSTRLTSKTGMIVRLSKGLGVNVRLIVARRSLFQLLHGRVSDWLDPRTA